MGNGVHDELIRKQDALDALMAERKHLLAKGQKGAEHILTHHGYNVIDELDVPVINVGDMISRQAAIDALDCINGVEEVLRSLPSAQPTNEMLERCRFEYIHACKIVSIPTPDVTEKDKQDAYAVIKALQPIFGDVPFAKVKRGDSDGINNVPLR